MGRATATITTTQQVAIAPKLQRKLMTELNGYGQAAAQEKIAKGAKGEHSAEVLALSLEGVDAEKYELEGFKVTVSKNKTDKRLDTDKLKKRMVSDGKYSLKAAIALLADCTTEKPKKDFVRITAPGESEDE